MHTSFRRVLFAFVVVSLGLLSGLSWGQSGSNAGTIMGSVVDPTGAVIPGAKVSILNPVSGYNRATVTDGV